MSTDERYDEATVDKVADEIRYFLLQEAATDRPRDFAEHIVAALADAGLLLPPDVEANRQYGRRMPSGMVIASPHPEPTHYRLLGPWTEVPQ